MTENNSESLEAYFNTEKKSGLSNDLIIWKKIKVNTMHGVVGSELFYTENNKHTE